MLGSDEQWNRLRPERLCKVRRKYELLLGAGQCTVSWVHTDDKNIIPNPFFFFSTEALGISEVNLVSSYEYVFWQRIVEKMSNVRQKMDDSGSSSCSMTD